MRQVFLSSFRYFIFTLFLIYTHSSHGLESSGYLRSGFGFSESGSSQACFKAAGALAKHRLGNECETYFELGLKRTFAAKNSGDYIFRSKVLFALQTLSERDWESTQPQVSIENSEASASSDATLAFREAYVEASKDFDNSHSYWIGKRFYRRRDIHMLDYYLLINTGTGAGVENIPVGMHKLSVALIRNLPRSGVKKEGPAQFNLDLRFGGVPVPVLGQLETTVIYGYTTAHDAYSRQKTWRSLQGVNLSFLFDKDTDDGHNLLAIQYGQGLFGGIGPWSTTGLDQFGAWGSQNIKNADKAFSKARNKSHTIRVVDQFVSRLSPNMSNSFVLLAQSVDFGGYNELGTGITNDRPNLDELTLGLRPIYHLSSQCDLALEYGHTLVKNAVKSDTADKYHDSQLQKLTLATMLSQSEGYWARPQLRLFATHAEWNKASRGKIAGAESVYGSDTNGWSAGAQLELWW